MVWRRICASHPVVFGWGQTRVPWGWTERACLSEWTDLGHSPCACGVLVNTEDSWFQRSPPWRQTPGPRWGHPPRPLVSWGVGGPKSRSGGGVRLGRGQTPLLERGTPLVVGLLEISVWGQTPMILLLIISSYAAVDTVRSDRGEPSRSRLGTDPIVGDFRKGCRP